MNFDPPETDDNFSMTDPRGESVYSHALKESKHEYEPVVIREEDPYWWTIPVIFWGAAVLVLLIFRTV